MSLIDFVPVGLAIAAFGLRWYVHAEPRAKAPEVSATRTWRSNVAALRTPARPA